MADLKIRIDGKEMEVPFGTSIKDILGIKSAQTNILLFHYLDNLKTAALPVPSNNKQLLHDLANQHKILRQYYRCKILSKITFHMSCILKK